MTSKGSLSGKASSCRGVGVDLRDLASGRPPRFAPRWELPNERLRWFEGVPALEAPGLDMADGLEDAGCWLGAANSQVSFEGILR